MIKKKELTAVQKMELEHKAIVTFNKTLMLRKFELERDKTKKNEEEILKLKTEISTNRNRANELHRKITEAKKSE